MSDTDSPRGFEGSRGNLEMMDTTGGKGKLLGNYTGDKDKNGQPHGRGKVDHLLGDEGSASEQLVVVEGEWLHGKLTGFAKITTNGYVIYEGIWNAGWMTLQYEGDAEIAADVTGAHPALRPPSCVNDLDMGQLEGIWRYCSYFTKQSHRNNPAEYASWEKEEDMELVPYAGGPTDLFGFVRLVFIWFFSGIVFVLIVS